MMGSAYFFVGDRALAPAERRARTSTLLRLAAPLLLALSFPGCAGASKPPQTLVPASPPMAEGVALAAPTLPVAPVGKANVRSIASGAFHTCALGEDGRIACWGSGAEIAPRPGEDDGEPAFFHEYRKPGAVALDAGAGRTCARFVDGRRDCWGPGGGGGLLQERGGSLFLGTLGAALLHERGAVLLQRPHPATGADVRRWEGGELWEIPSLAGARWVGVTLDYVVAGTTDGAIRCASTGARGFVCPGVLVDGWWRIRGVDARQVAVAPHHFCALRRAGDVVCTVEADSALGTRTELSAILLPRAAIAIASSWDDACAQLDDGALWCWDLRGARTSNPPVAELVPGVGRVRQIASGVGHHCALDEAGDVWCWGLSNRHGELGPGTTEATRGPVRVRLLP